MILRELLNKKKTMSRVKTQSRFEEIIFDTSDYSYKLGKDHKLNDKKTSNPV